MVHQIGIAAAVWRIALIHVSIGAHVVAFEAIIWDADVGVFIRLSGPYVEVAFSAAAGSRTRLAGRTDKVVH